MIKGKDRKCGYWDRPIIIIIFSDGNNKMYTPVHTHLSTWVKYRNYVVLVYKWSSAKTANVGFGTGPLLLLLSLVTSLELKLHTSTLKG